MRNKYSKNNTASRKRGRRQSWLQSSESLLQLRWRSNPYGGPWEETGEPFAANPYTLLPMSAAKAGDRG